MINQNIEEKRNKLNLEIRFLLSIIEIIDDKKREYENYVENTMSEEEFLNQQIKLVSEAKERLVGVFKD